MLYTTNEILGEQLDLGSQNYSKQPSSSANVNKPNTQNFPGRNSYICKQEWEKEFLDDIKLWESHSPSKISNYFTRHDSVNYSISRDQNFTPITEFSSLGSL